MSLLFIDESVIIFYFAAFLFFSSFDLIMLQIIINYTLKLSN
jgi:hypothetical protein